MSTMWTAASFNTYLLLYLNKYLAGSIFVNYYVEAAAGVTSLLIATPIYTSCKTMVSFIVSYSVTLLGAITILLFEVKVFSPSFVTELGVSPSPHPSGSPEEREYYLRFVIPVFNFLAKVGTGMTFNIAYFASFSNTTTFPLLRRSTAIGICNFCARLATAFAPFVAEVGSPIPISVVVAVSFVGLAASFTFPFPSEEPDVVG